MGPALFPLAKVQAEAYGALDFRLEAKAVPRRRNGSGMFQQSGSL